MSTLFKRTLVTPLLADTTAQAKPGAGYNRASFTFAFDACTAICPQGNRVYGI
jgi:hypothetical protein